MRRVAIGAALLLACGAPGHPVAPQAQATEEAPTRAAEVDAGVDAAAAPEPVAASDEPEVPPPDETPATPAPTPSIARAELPASDTRTVVPLTEHIQNHIRNVGRREHHARVRIVDGLYLRASDGSSRALVLYEYSRWESCVYTNGGDAAARQECLESEDFSYEGPRAELRACNAVGVMRIDFGPPAPGAEESTGDTGFAVNPLGTGGCQLASLNELSLRDVDGDGQAELVVDITRTWPDYSYRGDVERIDDGRSRSWRVLREDDLEPEAELVRARYEPSAGGDGTPSGNATRFELRDVNGDRRPDLVMDVATYFASPGDCGEDADGWPDRAWRDERGNGCDVHVEHQVARYLRREDRWDVAH